MIYKIYSYTSKYDSDKKNKKYTIMIIEKQKQDDSKIVYIVKLNGDKFLLNIYIKNKYNNKKNFNEKKLKKITTFRYGDNINVNGKILIPETLGNIGEFNYRKYLNSKGIHGVINAYDVEYVDNIGKNIIKSIYSVKERISSNINKNLDSREAELLKSMLYGDTRSLDQDIKIKFNNIGIGHITAVSGSNLSIILVIITVLLSRTKINQKVIILIQVISIVIFCIIASLELSVLRAGIMSIILIICKYRGINMSLDKSLIITLFLILINNPFRIYNMGMLFSFLAIMGISKFSNNIYNFLESKIKWNIKNKILSNVLCKIAMILSITISSNILILPLSIFYFNTFSLIFILSNLLISTLSSFINILGIISIFITKIPYISSIVYYILELALKLLINITSTIDKININISVKSFPIFFIFIYYLYILILCIKFKAKNKKKLFNYQLNLLKQKVLYILCVLVCLWYIHSSFFDNYIYFFNVGQGEMIVVKYRNSVVMIDSGSITNDTSYIFKSFSEKENIKKIDALIISHFHSDHTNGLENIIKDYKIEYVIYSYPYEVKTEEYVKFKKWISNKAIKQIIVKSGDNIKINKINIDIVNPNSKYIKLGESMDENENANSLVFNISLNKKNYLFTGDSIKASEKYILKNLNKININKIDLIKVAHHGSKTSSSEYFIQNLMPRYAIISAKKKVYNHPSKETVNILNKYNIKTYITEKVGGIKVNI